MTTFTYRSSSYLFYASRAERLTFQREHNLLESGLSVQHITEN
jgi:hypothetical protein